MKLVPRDPRRLLAAVAALTFFTTAFAADTPPVFQVGAAKIDITPELPIRLSGYASRREEATRVERPLHARALALGAGDAAVVLVTVEAIGVSEELSDAVASALRESHGLERSRVAVCATHIHTGPSIAGVLPYMFSADLPAPEVARIERYTHALQEKLIAVARAALADRRPGRLAWAEGSVDFAQQRRLIVDGKWKTFGSVPDGFVDHALPLLRVTDAQGKIRAVFTSYACHCTTLGGRDNYVHSDWAGDAAARIEQNHPEAVALVAIGCGGDANPNPGGGLANVARHGQTLADEVERLLRGPLRPLDGGIGATYRRLELDFDQAVTPEELRARVASPNFRAAHVATKLLAQHEAGHPLPAAVPYPVQAWTFGDDLAMVFLGGEVVSEYSLRLRRELDSRRLWINAYANALPCYIPSARMFAEGGYEVEGAMHHYGWPSRLAIGTEDRIVRTVHGMLPAVFGLADAGSARASASRRTVVSIDGDAFLINGRPTYEGRWWRGRKIEGLLMNARLVQGIFDDLNPDTVQRWAYPDTGRWDPERNTREFLAAMPEWRRHGLLAFTLCLQGGSPLGYSEVQPWENSAFEPDGTLRPAYLGRLRRILDRADELGMVVIVGYFYTGQDERLRDEQAVIRATDNITEWLLAEGYRNVLVEVNNECDIRFSHPILQPARVHELIARVKGTQREGRRLLAGTSYRGGVIPGENVIRASDFLLLHGNEVKDPARIAAMVRETRSMPGYRPMPILFNEDDHFDFDRPTNHLLAAVGEYASWGYFDYRMAGEGFDEGFQSMPANWSISSRRKRGFFGLVREMTGTAAPEGTFPGADWDVCAPEAVGVDAERLERAVRFLERRSGAGGVAELAIVRDGRLIWHGADIDRKHGVWSVTKAFTNAVLGHLIARGVCTLDTRAADHVPVLAPKYSGVTLRHFATMTSGYDAVGGVYGKTDPDDGSLTPLLPAEPVSAPGAMYSYFDDAMRMHGRVLTAIAGRNLEAYFREAIARPIGMPDGSWEWMHQAENYRPKTIDWTNPDGHDVRDAAAGLAITARSLARFGWLMLNRGCWNGRSILDPTWVEQSTAVQVPATTAARMDTERQRQINTGGVGRYGYMWWAVDGADAEGRPLWPEAPPGTYAATGWNHNLCVVIPAWRVVIVRTGTDGTPPDRDEIWSTFLGLVREALR